MSEAARKAAKDAGITTQSTQFEPAIANLSLYAKHLYPDLSMEQSVDLVGRALKHGYSINSDDPMAQRGMTQSLLRPGAFEHFTRLLRQTKELNKGFDVEVWLAALVREFGDEQLAKSFSSALDDEARNAAGEWTSGSSPSPSRGQVIANETADGVGEAAARGAGSRAPKKTPWYSPSRFVPEFGSNLIGDVASFAAARALGGYGKLGGLALETIAPKVLGQAGGRLAATGVRYGVKGAAGYGAYLAGTSASKVGLNAATDAGYRAAGAKRPPAAANATLGQTLASGTGNVVGSVVGSHAASSVAKVLGPRLAAQTLGREIGGDVSGVAGEIAAPELGPVSGIAAQSIGGYAGGVLAESLYDAGSAISRYFGGYDKQTAHKVLSRYGGAPRAAKPSVPAAV